MKEISIKKLCESTRLFYETNFLRSSIIGISGGIDSAVVAALIDISCANTCLIGRSIPIISNKKDEIRRAQMVGEAFCQDFKTVGKYRLLLTYMCFKLLLYSEKPYRLSNKQDPIDKKIRLGNLKARMRMIYLYHLAHLNKGIVLSTDNFTEYLLGFWTLHGDVGDFGPIQNAWKTEVYELAGILIHEYTKGGVQYSPQKAEALYECAKATPTDGLGVTDTDLQQLGATSYEVVDHTLKKYLDQQQVYVEAVVDRHLKSDYKRLNPFNLSREDMTE